MRAKEKRIFFTLLVLVVTIKISLDIYANKTLLSDYYNIALSLKYDEIITSSEEQKQKQQPKVLPEKVDDRVTIGYAISITGCPEKEIQLRAIYDGAAVLQHSIHVAASQSDRYGYKLYAFVHPNARSCGEEIMKHLDYEIQIRSTPINVSDIKNNTDLQKFIQGGCCGEKELLKLYSLLLFDHPVVVHLDVDVMMLKPLDHLFDIMLMQSSTSLYNANTNTANVDYSNNNSSSTNNNAGSAPIAMWPNENYHHRIESMFTRDYPMRGQFSNSIKRVPMQGGFWIVKPSQQVFDEFVDLVLRGGDDFEVMYGYGGRKISEIDGQMWQYGGAQFQGLVSYYYGYLRHPDTSYLELHHCYYDTITDNPISGGNQCQTGEPLDECLDCRSVPMEHVYSAHLTKCRKPWWCASFDVKEELLCSRLHNHWFKLRYDFELKAGMINNNNQTTTTTPPLLVKPDFNTINDTHDVKYKQMYCPGIGGPNYRSIYETITKT